MTLAKSQDDEVYVIRKFDIKIDIAALIDQINHQPSQYKIEECRTKKLLKLTRADRFDGGKIIQMQEARLNQPILVAFLNDIGYVIDGNHRLLKRNELGRETTSYIVITQTQLSPFLSDFWS